MVSGLTNLSHKKTALHKTQYVEKCNDLVDDASDCFASKGFQMARIKLAEGLTVDVCNSHFEAGGSDKDLEARVSRVDAIQKAMEVWPAGCVIVILGIISASRTPEKSRRSRNG